MSEIQSKSNELLGGARERCAGKLICYCTRPGDTLGTIAQKFDTTAGSLINLNPCVNFNRLCPGTRLRVIVEPLSPNCPISRQYIVARGENLNSIALRFNTTPQALLLANPNYPPSYFRQGNIICLPA